MARSHMMFLPAVFELTIIEARPLMPECSSMLNVRLELAGTVSVKTTLNTVRRSNFELSLLYSSGEESLVVRQRHSGMILQHLQCQIVTLGHQRE